MLEELMNIIQSKGQNAVVNNPDVPNEHNEAVMQSAGGSILDTIKGMIAQGQGDQVVGLGDKHPAAQQMQQDFADNIIQKFGINGGAAKDIAASLIPAVLAQLKGSGAQDGSAGFNLSSISSMLGKTGLDKDGDGDVDLKDVTKMFGF